MMGAMEIAHQTPPQSVLPSSTCPPATEYHFTLPPHPARVAALIVNFNTRARVEACLTALRRAAVAGGLQVVVVDNASADESAAAVRAGFPDAELIANAANRGYAAANNQALARSTAPYLLLLNPDTAVEPAALEEMAVFLDTHPAVAAVTANLVGVDGTSRAYVFDFPRVTTLLLKETALARLFPHARDRLVAAYERGGQVPTCAEPVPQPPGACLMLRRSALDGGLFDERFPLYFNDVDLCRRLHRHGSIYFLPAARVLHERGEGGLNRAPETAMLEHAVSAVRYFRKHHGLAAATALYLGLAVEFTAKALLGSLFPRGARAPFRGTRPQNLARLARFLLDVSYFDRGPEARGWRRLVLRSLEEDLWGGRAGAPVSQGSDAPGRQHDAT
jgi:N-acetylglucosaminyl-diphospho-decaprenol L-rhamnosyltransferase